MWNKQVEGMGNGMGKMKVCSLVLSALLILVLVPVVSAEENQINLTFICYDGTALKIANETNPYNESINVRYISGYSNMSEVDLSNQDIIFTYMLWSAHDVILDDLSRSKANGTVLIDICSYFNKSDYDYTFSGTPPYGSYEEQYFFSMGPRGTLLQNTENFLIYLAKEYANKPNLTTNWTYDAPVEFPSAGLYHPDAVSELIDSGNPEWFYNITYYLVWYQNNSGNHHTYDPNKPTIGMWFHNSDFRNANTEVIDALIHDIESKGCNVIAGFETFNDIPGFYCDANGETLVQCVISLKSFRLNYWNPEQGVEELEYLDVPVLRGLVASESFDPADANRGIPSSEVVRKTASPSLDGIFDYIVIGTDRYDMVNQTNEYVPIPAQIDWIVNRSINWAKLKLTKNQDKKVAVIYYNYPSGKDNIGASYLDTISSMWNLLKKMNDSNYTVADIPENPTELLERLQNQGINAGSWAPGVLEEMVENRTDWGLELIPMDTYQHWFDTLPHDLKGDVIAEWGEPWSGDLPENKSLMLWENETGKYIVIPAVRCGNVWLMPQPARGFFQNDNVMYHSSIVPPPHQYIAFYLWLNNEWNPNAIIHLGTHGTHEWLPGSAYGMNRTAEWAPLLLQDLPNIYPYIVANVGEGLTAEYRGNALIIDHLTPTLERSGLYGEMANISRNIQEYYSPEMSTQVKNSTQKIIIDEMIELHLDVDLDINATELYEYDETNFSLFVKNVLHEYLEEIQGENIPYGMHILSEVPSTNHTGPERDELSAMVRAMMGGYFEINVTGAFYSNKTDYPLGIPLNDTRVDRLVWEVVTNSADIEEAQSMVYGYDNSSVTVDLQRGLLYKGRLLACDVELDRVLSALEAGFIPPAPGTDPVMNPNSVPTGRNFYGINPELYPSEASWELGKQLAQELLEDYYSNHGEYPEKVSFSRFGVEFIRDHGTLEAEVLYLLGVKPTWDPWTGKVNGLKIIPEHKLLPNYNSSKLGRPRIDVVYTTAGMRDAFPDKIKMIDQAVKLANSAPHGNYTNYVNESTKAIYEELCKTYDNETAAKLSTMRCFAVRDGTYEIGVSNSIGASGTWDDEEQIANLYLDKMGYAYGEDLWGEKCSELLIANLRNVEASVHSDSSNLYDMLDNDDVFQYFGGLNLATRHVSGSTPDMYISDTRDPNGAQMVGLSEYLSKNLRSRYFNPKWIEGMQKSGYAGGRMMAEFVNNLWGWEVSDPDLIDDTVWEEVYQTYINNPDMEKWFNQYNPGAYQSITARMLEATRKLDSEGNPYWNADPEVINTLVKEYVESVAENGVTCCHHTCGNPLLDEYISGRLSVAGLSAEDIEKYRQLMDEATGLQTEQPVTETVVDDSSSGAWRRLQKIRAANESTDAGSGAGLDTELIQDAGAGGEGVSDPGDYVEGYEMQDESAQSADAGPMSFSGADIVGMLLVVLAAGAIYIGFRRRGG